MKQNLYLTILLAFTANQYVKAQQNILFIIAEDMSLDLGCYGNKHVYTPNIDRLASEGCRFTNAYTTYSVSSPSRGSIYTGLYPHQNGQIGLATHKYSLFSHVETMPTYLKKLGYRTGCIGKIHVNPESKLPFDFWEIRTSNFAKKGLHRYAEKAYEFMTSSDKPFCLIVNFPDSHFPVQKQVEGRPSHLVKFEEVDEGLPFVGISSPEINATTANYYNCINRLDESVGLLLDALKAAKKEDNTIIFFISDHGAQFSRGKHSNYEGGLKIPFIIKYPKLIKHGEVRDEFISVIDFLPTFIGIAKGEKPEYLPGYNILDLWENKDVKWREYIFAGGMGSFPQVHFPRRSVRDKRYKLILNENAGKENPHFYLYNNHIGHFSGGTRMEEIVTAPANIQKGYSTWINPPQYELYDLLTDPYEWNNLADRIEYKEVLERLKNILYNWRIRTSDMIFNPNNLNLINEEMDSVYKNKKVNDYQKNPAFKYRYLNYLNPKVDN